MKNKTIHISLFPFLVFVVFCLVGASLAFAKKPSKPAIALKKADDCRKSLYRSAKKRKYRHNWQNCISRYRNIYTRYPKSDQAPWAMYRGARMRTNLYKYSGKQDDLNEAIELYRRLTDEYKHHKVADDAQYRIGEAFYVYKNDPAQAYVEFLKVDIKFPSGDMRPKARVMLDELSVVLSKKETQKGGRAVTSSGTGLTPVRDIRHWSTPTYTRVVIDLQNSVKYTSHLLKEDKSLKKPRRLYVDLEKAHVGSDIESSIPISDGLLRRARAGQYSKDTVRVVLDIDNIGGYKIFHLYDPFRIVVDVRGMEKIGRGKKRPSKAKERRVRRGIKKVKEPDKNLSLARQLGLSVNRIVIDPGHGGKDPGTYTRGGIKEKDIVLKLGKILATKIEKKLGREAVLTRNRDVFLSLERRTAFANMRKADLFISLHINAHKLRNVRGLETYFLNMATDQRAVMVAARENATSEKNISDLQAILNDLMLNTKITESSRLAHQVQKGMVHQVKSRYREVRDLGVKQAPFYVLIGAQMPAVLVETGFITNATERKRLLSDRYLDKLADGIVSGISVYIESIDQVYTGG
jgi:N-acetylmuramoyl-L-alanine amidase